MVDANLRRVSNTDRSPTSHTGLFNGTRTSSRLGFRGRESLSSDLQAMYMLEMGIEPGTGAVGGGNRTFNRFSFVGLKSKSLGEVTLGLQNSSIHELLAFHGLDALEVGSNPDWTSYVGTQYLPKYDRAVRYGHQIGNVAFSAMVVLDDARAAKDRPRGATIVYKGAGWQLGGALMQEEALNGNVRDTRRSVVVGGTYDVGAFRWSGFYLQHDNEAFRRRDQTYVAGFSYAATARLLMLGRFLHTATNIDGRKGQRQVSILTAEYSLSNRTQPYVGVDFTTFSGASVPSSQATSRTGLTLGLRHRF